MVPGGKLQGKIQEEKLGLFAFKRYLPLPWRPSSESTANMTTSKETHFFVIYEACRARIQLFHNMMDLRILTPRQRIAKF